MEDARKLNMQMKDAETEDAETESGEYSEKDKILSGSYRCSDAEEWRAWI